MKINNIASVLKNDMCTGCGLCAETLEDLTLTSGFIRPRVGIEESRYSKFCPGIKIIGPSKKDSEDKQLFDSLWGRIYGSHAGCAVDKNLRYSGSSGGAISAILTMLLDNKHVDAVLLTGADKTNPLINSTFKLYESNRVVEFSGSRYSPSAPLVGISEILNDDLKYAIVGKPCDISALRQIIENEHELKSKVIYLLSFFCAGVPNISGTEQIIREFGIENSDVASLRYRGNGWPGYTTVIDKKGSKYMMPYSESWGKILNRKLQTRCKFCVDGIGESADIVCADVWDVDKYGKTSFDEADGKSLIITRTKSGKKILELAVKDSYIEVSDYDIKNLKKIQPFQYWRRSTHFVRVLGMTLFGIKVTRYRGANLIRIALGVGLKENLGAALGTIKRLLGRKI